MSEALLAEFTSPEALARAAVELKRQGYTKLDAHTPYTSILVREALGLPRTRLPFAVLAAGVAGAGLAYALQWLLVARLYPLDVGGRPPHFPLAFVPITFEMGVLCAALAAFFGVLFGGRLVLLWDPVFEVDGFESASVDAFWLRVEGGGEPLDEALRRTLSALGARRVTLLSGVDP